MLKILIIENLKNLSCYTVDTMSQENTSQKILINTLSTHLNPTWIYINQEKILKEYNALKNFNKYDNIEFILNVEKNKISDEFCEKFKTKFVDPIFKNETIFYQILQSTDKTKIFYFLKDKEPIDLDKFYQLSSNPEYFGLKGYVPLLSKHIKHILVFGNDWTINDFNFSKLENINLTTAGVNRIWHKHECDFLYFVDPEILKEILKEDITIENKILYADAYLKKQLNKNNDLELLEEFKIKYNTQSYPNQFSSINSLTWMIQTLNKYIFPDIFCVFYIYGVSLTWEDEKHHFWMGDERVNNPQDKERYCKRFDSFYNDFEKLTKENMKLISCSEKSRLNHILKYEPIDIVLSNFKIKECV